MIEVSSSSINVMRRTAVPDRWGSSEKDSKALPPSGLRWILHVGASKITEDLTFASAARNSPTRVTNSGSKEAPSAVPH